MEISIDSPNVNWKMLKVVKKSRKHQDPSLLDTLESGSCGLHAVHGSFWTGRDKTNWKLRKLLKPFHFSSDPR